MKYLLLLITLSTLMACSSMEAYKDMTPAQREEYKAEKREQIQDAKAKLDEVVKDYENIKAAVVEAKEN